MDDDRFAWVRQPSVIDSEHPDFDTLIELDDMERRALTLLAGEDPDGTPAPPVPIAPTAVDVPAIALTVSREQAAALLSISVDTFERRVLPELRVVQVGRRQLVPVRELESWVSSRSARALRG